MSEDNGKGRSGVPGKRCVALFFNGVRVGLIKKMTKKSKDL